MPVAWSINVSLEHRRYLGNKVARTIKPMSQSLFLSMYCFSVPFSIQADTSDGHESSHMKPSKGNTFRCSRLAQTRNSLAIA